MSNYNDIKYEFPASSISSGTFADARIASSNVSQHATSFDDNKIINDISTLALREASNENRVAYNAGASSVDVFQDATGIDTLTTAERNSDEFVRSFGASTGTTEQYRYSFFGLPTITLGSNVSSSSGFGSQSSPQIDPYVNVNNYDPEPPVVCGTNTGIPNCSIVYDYGSAISVKNSITICRYAFNNVARQIRLEYSTDNTNWTGVDFSSSSELSWFKQSVSDMSVESNFTSGDSSGNMNFENWGNYNTRLIYHKISIPSTAISARYWRQSVTSQSDSGQNFNIGRNIGFGCFSPEVDILGVNPTGNFTGSTITVSSSVSSMGAVITYQDHSGTNALNTDIVLQLSADGGSNFTTATLEALPDFSTGIKMAKANDVSVTAGTSLKYKILFANQSSGSKEARIRGVSLQY